MNKTLNASLETLKNFITQSPFNEPCEHGHIGCSNEENGFCFDEASVRLEEKHTFVVTLMANAVMSQTQYITASTEEEAKKIAVESCNDRVWKYESVNDDRDDMEIQIIQYR